MYNFSELANLKEVVYNGGNWEIHTQISIPIKNQSFIQDKTSVINFSNLLANAISIHKPGKCYVAEKEEGNAYSMFQLVENSCIVGDFFHENNQSTIDIFTSKKLDVEEVLRVTQKFFDSSSLEIKTVHKKNL